ncbi:MAG: tRNA (adenine(22)-N(1))-methyltransferase TrmK [Patescibacteria group bacterium]|jgi:HemK-like putative methylase
MQNTFNQASAIKLINKNIASTKANGQTFLYIPQIKNKLLITAGVFNPTLTNVTPFFAKNINIRWKGEKFLDLCTGSGFLAILEAQKGAIVTASDINKNALNCAKKNINRLKLNKKIKIIKSDLFSALKNKHFDTITINPPLIPIKEDTLKQNKSLLSTKKNVIKGLNQAMYDPNMTLLKRFFNKVNEHLNKNGRILIVYSNSSEKLKLNSKPIISILCKKYHFKEKKLNSLIKHGEKYTIFEISRMPSTK